MLQPLQHVHTDMVHTADRENRVPVHQVEETRRRGGLPPALHPLGANGDPGAVSARGTEGDRVVRRAHAAHVRDGARAAAGEGRGQVCKVVLENREI